MQIDLLRHGECEGGAIFRGSLDVALTDTGWQQMQNGLAELNAGWAAVVCSPLIRCSRFARAVAANAGLALHPVPELREIDFGDWEGQLVEKIWREQEALCSAWCDAPDTITPPNGEPFSQFRARVLHAVTALEQQYAQQRLLLVGHGGVIKLLLTEALGTGAAGMMKLKVDYGFSASVAVNGGRLTLAQPLPNVVEC